MRRIVLVLAAVGVLSGVIAGTAPASGPLARVGMLSGVIADTAPASGRSDEKAAPRFVTTIPPGYRDWTLISVAREEGALDDIRAVLGNERAIKAYREGTLPFPDGSIIARIAWSYDASSRVLEVRWHPDHVSAPTVIIAPGRVYPQGVTVDCGGCTVERDGDELHLGPVTGDPAVARIAPQ